jgi:ATP-dependent Clp protease ATP-binding subunit ClpA
MNSIYIYFGPRSAFDNFLAEKYIGPDDFITFSKLIKKHDEINSRIPIFNPNSEEIPEKERIEITNLVAYSDEYASVKEHVLLNFDGFISGISVDNIYLQNPTELLLYKVKIMFPDTKVEYYKYLTLNENILIEINDSYHNTIIGQSKVLKQLLVSLIPLTLKENKKPIVLLFWGPSGVGKTETAKFLASKLGGALFRKQLSMFQNNEFSSYLFGGYHYEKSFAKELLERETNVILLDEFDKANNVFHSAFYQLFDEGVFEDKNYSVQIQNSIIICTSNYNSLEHIQEQLGDPIFSRFDVCIEFQSLDVESIKKIIERSIEEELGKLNDNTTISKETILVLFSDKIHRFNNVRRIKNLVKEVIYSKVLDRILSDRNISNK